MPSRVLFEGDVCTLTKGKKGICKALSNCKPAYERLHKSRQKPIHCSFKGFEEIVCCFDDTALSMRKSQLACQEYSNEIPLRVNPFIIDGEDAEPGQFPHMAALGYIDPSEPGPVSWKCGGTLISDRHVLTAAHCVVSTTRKKPPVEVLLGAVNLEELDFLAQKYHVKKITLHPDYNIASAYNDIAIIELDATVKFSDNVQPACLFTKEEVPNFGLKVTGWGQTSNSRSSKSNTLKTATLASVPNGECSEFYRNAKKVDKGVLSNMLCAGDPKKDTCQGDSGGPLQVLTPDSNIYSVVGITSIGPAVCGGNIPGIYTRVSTYVDWIEKEVWG
ncbi:Serine protease snake [Blattella germanica]|nr:Serine protease snake [Blattella germanica]